MNRMDHFNEGRGGSDDEVNKKFNDIVMREALHSGAKQHISSKGVGSVEDLEPMESTLSTSCQNCDEEIEPNAVYHPGDNTMHYRCPECKKTSEESNWLEKHITPEGIKTISPWDGSEVTPENIREHISEPDPKQPKVTWKEVQSKKWQDDLYWNDPDW